MNLFIGIFTEFLNRLNFKTMTFLIDLFFKKFKIKNKIQWP